MTGLSDLAAWGLTALLLCAALLMLRRPLAWLIRLALRSSLGLAVLAVLSQTGGAAGPLPGRQPGQCTGAGTAGRTRLRAQRLPIES